MRALTFLARRFVAGETHAQAIEAVRKLNKKGLRASLDFLGEDTETEAQAAGAADEYTALLAAIHGAGVEANVSLKLTQFGLNLGPAVAKRHLGRVLEQAKRRNVGTVLQSMLRRTPQDVAYLNKAGIRVRLCKGAYKEPADVAFPGKAAVNEAYDSLARELLDHGAFPGLATHDDDRIEAAIAHAKAKGIRPDRFEFQMLYGLRSRRWSELHAAGWGMRVYVPYGTHWLPYFSRRLRERKENVLFIVRNMFRS
ncbi:MAG: proline dehydrogenase [Elusimicrobia bacterium]|nr:MAG: proline dehydrogenase [Elusimicrobiota bacterium]